MPNIFFFTHMFLDKKVNIVILTCTMFRNAYVFTLNYNCSHLERRNERKERKKIKQRFSSVTRVIVCIRKQVIKKKRST